MESSSCIFCKIMARHVSSSIIYEDADVLVIKDINPKASIHYLILPKEHRADIRDFTQADKELAGSLLLVAKKLAQNDDSEPLDFKLVANNGPKSGQVVLHLHFHFLAGTTFGAV